LYREPGGINQKSHLWRSLRGFGGRGDADANGRGRVRLDPPRPFPSLSAFRAQWLFDLAGFRLGPAATGGAIVLERSWDVLPAVLTFAAIFLATSILERASYPLHLMPTARFVLRVSAALVGAAAGVAMAAAQGYAVGPGLPIVLGTALPLVVAISAWIDRSVESNLHVRMAVIGSASFAARLAAELRLSRIRSYVVVGWIDPKDDAGTGTGPRIEGFLPRLGSLDRVSEVAERHGIELLVHATNDEEGGRVSRLELFERVAQACLGTPVRMIEGTQLYEELLGHVPLGAINSAWFQYMMHPRYRPGLPWSKRLLDIVLSSVAAILAAPVFVVSAIVIKLTDGGPVLHRQWRLGEGGRPFEMTKLRTMRLGAEEEDGAQWSSADDDRVTPIGRLLRKTHLDELPQLAHVLRGGMTLVGPRPERPELAAALERTVPYYERRLLVKPGITGWAQVRCGYAGSETGTALKLCHDLFYLKHRSLLCDLMILVETVPCLARDIRDLQYDVRLPAEHLILDQSAENLVLDQSLAGRQ
jgi:exopolysaccharide biosynthesis polyprenyl glycosylphosphotransferase